MAGPEILALALVLSLVLAAAAWGLMGLFERRPSDPALREKGWALALYLPVLPAARPVVSARPAPVVTPRAIVATAAAQPDAEPSPTPVAASAPAETPEAPITNPSWVQSPQASWPRAASADLTSGSAVVSCTARADGRLTGCAVVSEEPVGAGFGPAAVEAAEKARLAPSMIDAGATGRAIQFTVRFRLG